jgi:hypothetical protein
MKAEIEKLKHTARQAELRKAMGNIFFPEQKEGGMNYDVFITLDATLSARQNNAEGVAQQPGKTVPPEKITGNIAKCKKCRYFDRGCCIIGAGNHCIHRAEDYFTQAE